MFDFDWTEIALIGVVALIAIGPKDLPIAIKTVAGFVKKARRMASEFQGHVDEMVREANLHEVRDQITQLKNFDLKGEIEKHVDGDGSIRKTFNENPMLPETPGYSAPVTEAAVEAYPVHEISPPGPVMPAPSFIPPTDDIVPPPYVPPTKEFVAPAFVPPDAASETPPGVAHHDIAAPHQSS